MPSVTGSHSFLDGPHRRYNPLSGEWVLVSPQRLSRPWQGQLSPRPEVRRPAYDPDCYLCPGNLRAGGARNPAYTGTFIFTNDFAALLPDTPTLSSGGDGLLQAQAESGTCRVLCFSPRHDLSLAEMPEADIRGVVDVWAGQVEELGLRFRWVQVFENKGEMMGASNPHPHCQVWAGQALPSLAAREDAAQRDYQDRHGSSLLMDYLAAETSEGSRVVLETEAWVAVVPFWAVWPFETMLLPRRNVARLPDLTAAERQDLASALSLLLTRYDNLFAVSFPYSMGWHGAPYDGGDPAAWQLHAHFYPPLLRSAEVRKFMVGYELLAEPQRDLTPEQAAARLRQLRLRPEGDS